MYIKKVINIFIYIFYGMNVYYRYDCRELDWSDYFIGLLLVLGVR